MKCFIMYAVLIMALVVRAEQIDSDSELSPNDVDLVNEEKNQKKRAIALNPIGGLEVGGIMGYNAVGIIGPVGYNGGILGYYGAYNPPIVAGLGGFNNIYNSFAGYPGGYVGYPYYTNSIVTGGLGGIAAPVPVVAG